MTQNETTQDIHTHLLTDLAQRFAHVLTFRSFQNSALSVDRMSDTVRVSGPHLPAPVHFRAHPEADGRHWYGTRGVVFHADWRLGVTEQEEAVLEALSLTEADALNPDGRSTDDDLGLHAAARQAGFTVLIGPRRSPEIDGEEQFMITTHAVRVTAPDGRHLLGAFSHGDSVPNPYSSRALNLGGRTVAVHEHVQQHALWTQEFAAHQDPETLSGPALEAYLAARQPVPASWFLPVHFPISGEVLSGLMALYDDPDDLDAMHQGVPGALLAEDLTAQAGPLTPAQLAAARACRDDHYPHLQIEEA